MLSFMQFPACACEKSLLVVGRKWIPFPARTCLQSRRTAPKAAQNSGQPAGTRSDPGTRPKKNLQNFGVQKKGGVQCPLDPRLPTCQQANATEGARQACNNRGLRVSLARTPRQCCRCSHQGRKLRLIRCAIARQHSVSHRHDCWSATPVRQSVCACSPSCNTSSC